jgi:hypothetical protein
MPKVSLYQRERYPISSWVNVLALVVKNVIAAGGKTLGPGAGGGALNTALIAGGARARPARIGAVVANPGFVLQTGCQFN